VACLVGTGSGALWQPGPAAAETIRELSWFIEAMHVADAHRISRGDQVTVAVVDTGVDGGHPDLKGRVLPGIELGDKASPDPRGDGRTDSDGHGTGMASLIAGSGHGVNSVLGIAPQARILPVRIAQTKNGSFQPADVYQGVRWAIDHGADIVNMSLGGERSTDAPWKKQLVDYAISKDVVLIAAAGNTGQGDRRVAEPASIQGVVSVSGITRSGRFWKGSARGPEVVVSAPAERLPMAAPSSVSDSGYVLADGTSGATALVSGVAALIRSAFRDISANDVINRLIRTAEDRGPAGRDEEYGYGVIDARAALEGDVPSVAHHPLVSPEAASSGEAAVARLAGRRTSQRALVVVGGFLGTVLLLVVVALLWHLARRSRQIVVAGAAPGIGPVQVPGGVVWGRPSGPGWHPGPQWSPPSHWQPGSQWPPGHQVRRPWPSSPPFVAAPGPGHRSPPLIPQQPGYPPMPSPGPGSAPVTSFAWHPAPPSAPVSGEAQHPTAGPPATGSTAYWSAGRSTELGSAGSETPSPS
jgi:type VII secretion-associated serine protease mycosin